MIPSQNLFTIELLSSFKPVLKKHFILNCSDVIIKLFCNIFNIKKGLIELQNVKIQSLKKKLTLSEKLCSSKNRLVLKRGLLASKQGLSLLRILKNSILRYLKLQCYEQQSNKETCSCSRWRLFCRSTTRSSWITILLGSWSIRTKED